MGCCAKMKNVLLGRIKSSKLHSTSSLTPPPHPTQIPFQTPPPKKNPLYPLGGVDQLTERQQSGTGQTCLGFSLPKRGVSSPCSDGRLEKLLFTLCHVEKRLKRRPILLRVTFRSWEAGKLRVNHLSWCHASHIRGR